MPKKYFILATETTYNAEERYPISHSHIFSEWAENPKEAHQSATRKIHALGLPAEGWMLNVRVIDPETIKSIPSQWGGDSEES